MHNEKILLLMDTRAENEPTKGKIISFSFSRPNHDNYYFIQNISPLSLKSAFDGKYFTATCSSCRSCCPEDEYVRFPALIFFGGRCECNVGFSPHFSWILSKLTFWFNKLESRFAK